MFRGGNPAPRPRRRTVEPGAARRYEVLGAKPGDDAGAVKKAYRKRCLLFHPDKNPHPRAADAFLLASAAYAATEREARARRSWRSYVRQEDGSPRLQD